MTLEIKISEGERKETIKIEQEVLKGDTKQPVYESIKKQVEKALKKVVE